MAELDTPVGLTPTKRADAEPSTSAAIMELLLQSPAVPAHRVRIASVDLARGVAVALMILSHGVVGLVPFDDFASYGQVPIHLITKFASSTFVIVFGMALAVAYLPRAGTERWPQARRKLLLTGLIVFFWYQVLTVAEMLYLFQPADIVDALMYRSFPSFVEILGFYAIALLWVPFFLPLWARMPLILRLFSPALMAWAGVWLAAHFHFWDIPQLRAIFVEDDRYYTWGQFSRGPLILLGLLIGEALALCYPSMRRRLGLAAVMVLSSVCLFASFLWLAAPDIAGEIEAVARNIGKHPPQLMFMLFSMGGALLILAFSIAGGPWLAKWLQPFTLIGTNALQAFIFHILVIFIGFRYLLGFWYSVSYEFALILTLGLIAATAAWNKLVTWIKTNQ